MPTRLAVLALACLPASSQAIVEEARLSLGTDAFFRWSVPSTAA